MRQSVKKKLLRIRSERERERYKRLGEPVGDLPELEAEHRQLAGWLRELQRYRFEISECKAVLDNPTPDVTENDRKRAMYVLQTFPDVRGGKS